ncbi:hypothetical protein CK203_032733 [Vitis vinifera]|uniref:Uncharacterized protein n=1 Tax=Vitis vinifera TaxID=29760 RepID=A0A438I8H4_VITVI|nr:hypothetical protein CK203_032733 [Vitis vinifera]
MVVSAKVRGVRKLSRWNWAVLGIDRAYLGLGLAIREMKLGFIGIVQLKMSPKKEIVTSGAAGQGGSRGRVKHIEFLSDGNSGNALEQFNAGLRLPLPSLFKQFLHYMRIPPALIHPNVIRVLMGCSILDMLFGLDLSLLEVIFVYTIKKAKNDIFSLSASIPSLQLVTGLPDSTKGAARGHVLVKGPWASFLVHREKEFVPNQSLRILGTDKRGRLVEWVEKVSFDRLNKLFEIAVGGCLKKWCSENTLFSKISPFTRRHARQTPKLAKNALTRGRRRGRKEPCGGHSVKNALPSSSESSPPGHEPATERLGSLPRKPDSLAMVMIDEPVAERLIPPRVLTTGFGERHKKRLYEIIELNNTSALVEYSEGVQPKAIREDRSGSTLVPDDDSPSEVPFVEKEAILASRKEPYNRDSTEGDSANEVVHIFVRPPSCAEMEKMLRQIPRCSDRRELFTNLLRVADHIKVFVSHHMGGEELRLRLEQSEANLAAAQKAAAEKAEA